MKFFQKILELMKLKMKQMKLINGKKKIKRDLKYEIKIIYIYIYIYIYTYSNTK